MLVLALQPLLVLIGIQVAGVRIDGFEQAVHRAQRDALHVRLFHVIALDAREHLGVNGQVTVGVFRRSALAAHGSEKEHKNEASGRGSDEKFVRLVIVWAWGLSTFQYSVGRKPRDGPIGLGVPGACLRHFAKTKPPRRKLVLYQGERHS